MNRRIAYGGKAAELCLASYTGKTQYISVDKRNPVYIRRAVS